MSSISSFSSVNSDSEGSEQQTNGSFSMRGLETLPIDVNLFRKQTITTKIADTKIVVSGRTSISQSTELRVSTYTGARHLSVKVPTRISFLEQRHGYLLKKSSKSRFGISTWNKRYFVLSRGKLVIYPSKKEYLLELDTKVSKTIDMREVTSVCFHYDRDAPVKSKKLHSK